MDIHENRINVSIRYTLNDRMKSVETLCYYSGLCCVEMSVPFSWNEFNLKEKRIKKWIDNSNVIDSIDDNRNNTQKM